MDTEQQPPAKSFWTVGHVTLLVLGSVVAIAGIVVVVAVLCRAHNYNAQQIALRRTAESKQLADARHKSLDAPSDDSDAASDGDPVVRQSQLHEFEKSFWKRTLDHVSRTARSLKDFVVKCFDETPQIRTPGQRGRVQNDIRRVQLERALIYQMCSSRCSRLNACRRSFLQVKDGYKSPRSLYDYWTQHPLDADAAKQKLVDDIAASGLSAKKYYEYHALENAAILQEITA